LREKARERKRERGRESEKERMRVKKRKTEMYGVTNMKKKMGRLRLDSSATLPSWMPVGIMREELCPDPFSKLMSSFYGRQKEIRLGSCEVDYSVENSLIS